MQDKTKEQLSQELTHLRQQVAELEAFKKEYEPVVQALTRERNLLRTLIDNLPDFIYAKDTESRFILVNTALAHFVGASRPDDFIGKIDFDFFPQELAGQYYADEQALIQSGQALIDREEIIVDQITGNKKWLSTIKEPLRDNHGKVIGLVGISRDISQRKKVEEALQKTHDELERRVEERTVALAQTNAALQVEITERKQIETALTEQYEQTQIALSGAQQSQALLRTIIDATPDWIFIKDQDHRFYLCNKGLAGAFNLTPEEVIGKNDLELGVPEEIVKGNPEKGIRGFWPDDREVMDTGQQKIIDVEPTFSDGQLAFLSTIKVPLKDDEGQVWGILGLVRDITKREQMLMETQILYEVNEVLSKATRLKNIRDRLSPVLSKHGVVMELYDRVVVAEEDIELPRLKPKKKGRQKFKSYSSIPITLHDEVIGLITMQSVERKDWFAESGMQLLRTIAANVSISIQNIRLFEEMQQAKEATEAANLELSQTLASLKATQSQLVESEKMAALGGLVAGVAHEINTPLGVGVTAASLLEDRTIAFLKTYRGGQMKRSDLEKYLETAEQSSAMILRNLERAAELIQSFKQVAVDQSTEEKRKFEVKKYLAEVLLSLRPKLKPTRHAVHINGSDELTLDSYPGTFAQVVTNLVMNSLLHAYESGEAGQLSFDFSQENNQVIFEYADDGQGIPEENLDKIFDPFFTTKRGQGGSGLGLHIIYNLVTQKLGGTISCESKVGQGTRFVIKIPTP